MSFPRRKIQLMCSTGTSPHVRYIADEQTGVVVEKVQDCNKPLPAAVNFKIANQMKAGVTLSEVPTKVVSNFSSDVLEQEVADVQNKVKKATKKNIKNNEVNNENT